VRSRRTQWKIRYSIVHTERRVGVGGKSEVSFWQDGGDDTQEEGGYKIGRQEAGG